MTPDQNDEPLLESMVDALLAQPIPAGPPDEVHRRLLALDESASRQTALDSPSYRAAWLADWVGTAAVVAVLLASLDFGWWVYVNATTPVGWFHDPATETWHVLYDNTRVEIRRPPAAIHKDA
jgi:hypothetical protein